MKDLKELNLLDRFLFAEAMEDPENMRDVLEIIFGKNTKNLPKRSRFYQSMIDSKLLEPGEKDFNKMNDVYIILIAPFDLFGEGKYMYTFQMTCQESFSVLLNDGATRIFLNTHGTNPEDVSPELVELLHYIENTTQEVADSCTSPRACLKNYSCNLHVPICGIFCLHSVDVARYAALIQAKSPTNCNAHLAESIFQTRSGDIRKGTGDFYEIKKYSGSSGCNSGEPLCGAGTTDKERTLGGGFCEKAASSY